MSRIWHTTRLVVIIFISIVGTGANASAAPATPDATPSSMISSTLYGPGLSHFSPFGGRGPFLYKGPSIQGSVPFVFRNTADETAYRVNVTGTARSADGKLIGVASTSTVVPAAIKPGEIGIGTTYFGVEIPADAKVDLKASYQNENGAGYLPQFDLVINEVGSDGNNLIGTAVNRTFVTLRFIGVDGLCFDRKGVVVGYFRGTAVDDQVNRGDSTAFTTMLFVERGSDLPDDPIDACPNYIIGVTGAQTD